MVEERGKGGIGLPYSIILALNGAFGIEFFVLLEHSTFLAGPAVVLSLFICGIITMISLFSYCELGSSISRVGGEYTFAKAAFGGFTAFLTGWMRWVSSIATVALAATGFSKFLQYFYPINTPIISVSLILLFTFISVRGTKEIDIATVFTFVGVFTLIVIVGLQKLPCLSSFPYTSIHSFMPNGVIGVFEAVMYSFSMFVGTRAVVAGSPQMKNPKKDLPKAILISIAIITLLYCSVAYVVVCSVHGEKDIEEPLLVFVAEKLLGNLGGTLMTIAGLSAALMSLTTTMMVQRSIIKGLSRDGYLPKFILSTESRLGRYISVAAGSAIAILLSVTGLIVFIGYVAGFASLMVFALVNLSLIQLRKKMPRLERPFKAPLYPYTPIIGVALTVLLLLFTERSALILGFEFMVVAVIIYHLKMVGYKRLRLAVAGVNLGIGGISSLVLYLMWTGNVTLQLPHTLRLNLLILWLIINVMYLVAGILNLLEVKRRPSYRDY